MFCNINCCFLNKEEDRCGKYSNQTLPRNIENKLFKCTECKEEKDESKNQIRHNY